jgi:hypothetical protein
MPRVTSRIQVVEMNMQVQKEKTILQVRMSKTMLAHFMAEGGTERQKERNWKPFMP